MSLISGKNILLGITAGIAAYKTASLVRLFVKSGAQVKVVMTPAAKDFITPLTLSTLSKNPVFSTFTQDDENETWNNHVELGLWADLMVIAPATANTLSKMANGTCDNLLLATYLSAKCPVYIAPAMDLDMYKHQSTQDNLDKLKSFGNYIIPVGSGELASGLEGEGRMAEPEEILDYIEKNILESLPLKNKFVLVTAGPTYEAIDPVRFIGNHSSGKMGFFIAKKAAALGAKVFLVSGPSSEIVNDNNIEIRRVTSAAEMLTEVRKSFDDCDIGIFSAAVSDFKPKNPYSTKIKKTDNSLNLELEKTPDVLSEMSKLKKNQILVGFALETDNEMENAQSKLSRKNLDIIVLNSLNDPGAGFGTSTNKVTFITADGEVIEESLKSK
ncbi:MAG: bifunctional phosphopantothenoylcysteine decarboxylase/phosphopantothenate--cysteine ligase CoaBC, partial [Flavobacteriaceae bacterium]|nr:bifunctional phosphopantothenoylcysteine decarboxylase/phosphopantothenate--cysteine ligase CoaBC [Flavobacteriaceae bacterium]